MSVYEPEFVVAVEIVEDAHVHRNDGEDYARQCDRCKLVYKLDANEHNRTWPTGKAITSHKTGIIKCEQTARKHVRRTLTHYAEQSGAEDAEIVVHGALRVFGIDEYGQPRCHVGLRVQGSDVFVVSTAQREEEEWRKAKCLIRQSMRIKKKRICFR